MEPPRPRLPDGDAGAAVRSGLQVTFVGAAVNIGLTALKFWGGVVGQSQALIADAVHSISDLLTDAVVIFGLRWGHKEADENHHFGHARIETFAGLVVGLALVLVGAFLVYHAVHTITEHRLSQPTAVAVLVAAASIILKETLFWYTVGVGRRLRSSSLVANAWHHRSDALSSVAVLLGVGAGVIDPNWRIADAYAAIVVAVLVAKVGIDIGWRAVREVVDTAPDREVMSRLTELALSVEGVREVHDVRARHSGPQILAEMHVVVDPDLTVREGHSIAKTVELLLREKIADLTSVIIHVDPDPKEHE